MRLIEVKDDQQLKEFVRFPLRLYSNSDYWVPSVLKEEERKLDFEQSVFQDRFDWKLWMIENGEKIVGRIACIIDSQEEHLAKWGWWDVEDDVEISRLLFDTINNWAKEKNARLLKGPLGFTNLDKTGLMTEGFDHPPTIAENYNYAYYKDHLRQLGFDISSEYKSFEIPVPEAVPERVSKMAKMLAKRYNWEIRLPKGSKKAKCFAQDAFQLMNASHAELEGHTKLSNALAEYYIDGFVPLVKTEYSCFVYKDEDLIGFGIALPNYSKAFRKMKGKIWPFGWWYILKTKWFHNKADLMIIGVHPEHRNKGVTACIFEKIMKAFISNGVEKVESNPELKENENVQRLWSAYQPVKIKEWKTFEQKIR